MSGEKRKRIGVYAGSFDPVTHGHLDIIQQARLLVDELHISVGVNHAKASLFTVLERIDMIEKSLGKLKSNSELKLANVLVCSFNSLLVDHAQKVNAQFIFRGLRAASDFESEFAMNIVNHKINPQIQTVFLPALEEFLFVSSSTVRELAKFRSADLKQFVTNPVVKALQDKYPIIRE